MLDEQEDKSTARNQMIAFALMAVLMIVYFTFLAPKMTPPPKPPQGPADTAGEQSESPAPVPAPDRPGLPPIETLTVAAQDLPDDEIVLEDENLQLVFTKVGARLKQATVRLHMHGDEEIALVPQPNETGRSAADTLYPLGLDIAHPQLGELLNVVRWDAEVGDRSVTFTAEAPGIARVVKTFTMAPESYVIDAAVTIQNLGSESLQLGLDRNPAFELTWVPGVDSHEPSRATQSRIIWRTGEANDGVDLKKIEEDRLLPDADWVAYRGTYFVVALKHAGAGLGAAVAPVDSGHFSFGVTAPAATLLPGGEMSDTFRVYTGPAQTESLAAAWETLPSVRRMFERFDFMDAFARFLLGMLNWFYGIIPNYGVAIILLTVVVRLAMLPLTMKSMKSMKQMQLLGPEMQELKEKYGNDQQEFQRRMWELYRERGVSPFGGCLPLLLQMPIFIALYRMLWTAYELRGAPFMLWITDLSQPDRLFAMPWMAKVPLIGEHLMYFNLLPLLMGAAMLVSQRVMPPSGPIQSDQQKMMMTIMPVFFSLICYKLASGLSLYIFTSTVLGLVQQGFTRTIKVEPPEKKKPKKKQHFYAAAQSRKRRIAKETKRQGKRPSE